VSAAFVWLSSDDARFVTGVGLPVAAGATAIRDAFVGGLGPATPADRRSFRIDRTDHSGRQDHYRAVYSAFPCRVSPYLYRR
jgi:hypothetical protein